MSLITKNRRKWIYKSFYNATWLSVFYYLTYILAQKRSVRNYDVFNYAKSPQFYRKLLLYNWIYNSSYNCDDQSCLLSSVNFISLQKVMIKKSLFGADKKIPNRQNAIMLTTFDSSARPRYIEDLRLPRCWPPNAAFWSVWALYACSINGPIESCLQLSDSLASRFIIVLWGTVRSSLPVMLFSNRRSKRLDDGNAVDVNLVSLNWHSIRSREELLRIWTLYTRL